jgi:hypothetical protein
MQPEPTDAPVETPLEDAAEQAAPAVPADSAGEAGAHRGLEVGEWDAVEQARTVALDDDYR